jgi:hypothetical protein
MHTSRALAHAGFSATLYFRNMDQSDPVIQNKMLQAYKQALDAEYISETLSPEVNWLNSFQKYAREEDPDAVNTDGTVKKDNFYDLLTLFLEAQVQ